MADLIHEDSNQITTFKLLNQQVDTDKECVQDTYVTQHAKQRTVNEAKSLSTNLAPRTYFLILSPRDAIKPMEF
jgi:hypothetical protein